jgi:hypothetical protein
MTRKLEVHDPAEEDQLVAFLKTLTDGYTPPAAKNFR